MEYDPKDLWLHAARFKGLPVNPLQLDETVPGEYQVVARKHPPR
jgi:hypothetical protein